MTSLFPIQAGPARDGQPSSSDQPLAEQSFSSFDHSAFADLQRQAEQARKQQNTHNLEAAAAQHFASSSSDEADGLSSREGTPAELQQGVSRPHRHKRKSKDKHRCA